MVRDGQVVRFPVLPNEVLLWNGRPSDHSRVPVGVLIPMALIFVIFFAGSDGNPPGVWLAFVVPGLIALLTSAAVRKDRQVRRSTAYALTNRRAIRVSGGPVAHVDSIPLSRLTEVNATEGRDRIGTIYCVPLDAGVWPRKNRHGRPRALFRLILEPNRVRAMLLDAQAQRTPPSAPGKGGLAP